MELNISNEWIKENWGKYLKFCVGIIVIYSVFMGVICFLYTKFDDLTTWIEGYKLGKKYAQAEKETEEEEDDDSFLD